MSNIKLPNGMELVFAPGCFDTFEGTQEELDELVKEITESFTNGDALLNATPLSLEDFVDKLTPEEIEEMLEQLDPEFDGDSTTSSRTLQ